MLVLITHTLIKKIVGKSKAEKLKSLNSMTVISVVSTMTKEIYIAIYNICSYYICMHITYYV